MEDALALGVRELAQAAQPGMQARLAGNLMREEGVEAEGEEEGQGHHHIELHIHRVALCHQPPPHQHDDRVECQNGHKGCRMRTFQLDEDVVQVGLIGVEGRCTAQYAAQHHAQRVEDGNRQDGQREGNQADIRTTLRGAGRLRVERPQDKGCHHRTHHERTAVADKHLRLLAKDIVEEEGDHSPCRHGGHDGHRLVSHGVEHAAEHRTSHHAVARREAIHTVDEVDGVDNAHGGKDGQRHRHPHRDQIQPEEAVEIVDGAAAHDDHKGDQEHLDQEAERGREAHDIIQRADIEHHRHRGKDGEELGTIGKAHGDNNAEREAEEDGNTAQHGNRLLLQFACIGVIHDVLVQGHSQHLREDQQHHQKGDAKRNDQM